MNEETKRSAVEDGPVLNPRHLPGDALSRALHVCAPGTARHRALLAEQARRRNVAVRLAERRAIVTGLLLLLLPAPAFAFSDLDYCRALATVDRDRCRVDQKQALLDCAEDYARDRYLATGFEIEALRECRRDARDERKECRAGIPTCDEARDQ